MTGNEIPAARRRSGSAGFSLCRVVCLLLSRAFPANCRPICDEARTGTLTICIQTSACPERTLVPGARVHSGLAVRDSVTYCGEITTTDATRPMICSTAPAGVSVIEKVKTSTSRSRVPPNQGHRLSGDKCPVGHS